MRFVYFGLAAACVIAAAACTAKAEVLYAKDEALRLAFPTATRVETQTFVLEAEQRKRVEQLAKTKVESSLFTFYKGYHGEELLGFLAIDTHIVKTMPETFMVVLTPKGEQTKVVILAFQEPPEYMASLKWLDQFRGKSLDDDLWPARGIHGIAGSTLTTHAMTAGVRKILALFKVLITEG